MMLPLGHQRNVPYNSSLQTPLLFASNELGGNEVPLPEEQERLTNLGAMIDALKLFVPHILLKSLPKEVLLPEVLLRICPSHFELANSYLPNIKGHVSYYATCKALQIFLTSLVLNPQVRFHIQLIRTSHLPEPNCVYVHSTKIHVRWTTCPEGCSHLLGGEDAAGDDQLSTARAKLGSHGWSGIDAGRLVDSLHQNWSLSSALADLGKGIVGLKKEESRLERVILGVFIFELNTNNDKILVHTVEDMSVVERREELDGKLRVC